MIAFLLFCILLCLCRPLRTLVGALFWIVVALMVWHWPSDERPASAPASTPAAVVEVERPAPVPEVQGGGPDFGPAQPAPWQGPRQPRPYRQQ